MQGKEYGVALVKNSLVGCVFSKKMQQILQSLDNGNPAHALKLISSHQNVTPQLLVVKSIALHRLARNDEALKLSQEVMDKQLAKLTVEDVEKLSALFVNLQRQDLCSQLYNKASQLQPNNEHLANAAFFTHVRAQNYDAQEKQALEMYKRFKKTRYLAWHVISMSLASKYATDEMTKKLKMMLIDNYMQTVLKEKQAEFEKIVSKKSADMYSEGTW